MCSLENARLTWQTNEAAEKGKLDKIIDGQTAETQITYSQTPPNPIEKGP